MNLNYITYISTFFYKNKNLYFYLINKGVSILVLMFILQSSSASSKIIIGLFPSFILCMKEIMLLIGWQSAKLSRVLTGSYGAIIQLIYL